VAMIILVLGFTQNDLPHVFPVALSTLVIIN